MEVKILDLERPLHYLQLMFLWQEAVNSSCDTVFNLTPSRAKSLYIPVLHFYYSVLRTGACRLSILCYLLLLQQFLNSSCDCSALPSFLLRVYLFQQHLLSLALAFWPELEILDLEVSS